MLLPRKRSTYTRQPIPASSVIAFAPRTKRAPANKKMGPPSLGSDINKIANRMLMRRMAFM